MPRPFTWEKPLLTAAEEHERAIVTNESTCMITWRLDGIRRHGKIGGVETRNCDVEVGYATCSFELNIRPSGRVWALCESESTTT